MDFDAVYSVGKSRISSPMACYCLLIYVLVFGQSNLENQEREKVSVLWYLDFLYFTVQPSEATAVISPVPISPYVQRCWEDLMASIEVYDIWFSCQVYHCVDSHNLIIT